MLHGTVTVHYVLLHCTTMHHDCALYALLYYTSLHCGCALCTAALNSNAFHYMSLHLSALNSSTLPVTVRIQYECWSGQNNHRVSSQQVRLGNEELSFVEEFRYL